MSCPICGSDNQAAFTAETNIHLSGLANLDNPGILVFPTLSVCLGCGYSHFSIPEAELPQLSRGTAAGRGPRREQSVDDLGLRRRISLGA
jgi:hypothetical protein